jgi:2OG-Fe(II) oxygenase superfamily
VDSTEKQGARFATLLLYLNEGMKGGETNFPRWANGHTFRDLRVTPKSGKAVLFYSQLPDGNLDDFSQHAALPVTDGEKVGALFEWCIASLLSVSHCISTSFCDDSSFFRSG